jgi:hypothetical protein
MVGHWSYCSSSLIWLLIMSTKYILYCMTPRKNEQDEKCSWLFETTLYGWCNWRTGSFFIHTMLAYKPVITQEKEQHIILNHTQGKIPCSLVLKLKVFRLLYFQVFIGALQDSVWQEQLSFLKMYQELFLTRHIKWKQLQ